MNNGPQVSEGRPHQIRMGTSTKDSDTVRKNAGFQGWSPRWLKQNFNIISYWSASNRLHRLGLTRRKLKKIVYGYSLTFYWISHVAYYGALTVAGTISLWWCRGKETISLVDCIFNAVSALTNTGLSSVLLRDFTPLGMFVLMVLMLLGHAVFVSLLPVYVRRFQFFRHDRALTTSDAVVDLGDFQHMIRHTAGVNCVTMVKKKASSTNEEAIDISRMDQGIDETPQVLKTGDRQDHGDIDAFRTCPEIKSEIPRCKVTNCCERSCKDRVTPQADHDTGLLERQSLITLSWLVPIYMIAFLSFGFVTLFCYTSFSSKGSSTVRGLYKAEGIHPVFTAIFLSISAFSNTGLSPLDDNMVPFAASPLVLVPLAALILAGNCMFPPTLRFIIWGLSVLKRTDDPQSNVYKYLLQFPRRCYTHLFPQVQTTWLMATVVAFNVVDMIAFCSLEWNSVAMTEDLSDSSPGIKLMDGIFQSLNTRSAGMNILQLSTLSPPLLVLYTAMM
ncbi:hypothetical protein KC19_8G016700 [Ceratodon purpureus]|uniref:Uncharacterized protein n=1 Tax=Ceratodon purpureus TaxID=3225 RepID=A0A8T0GW51_CERPU|nr:hypothetical protein KC19_N046700 [Ceratodon purpureus]KAG0563260.1 hypothetical protein KC19_8G016700 [Ceratodon purpureus]